MSGSIGLPGKKKSWNTKKTGTKLKKKPPPAVPLDDLTVRDCLMWNSFEGKKSGSAGVNHSQDGEPFVYRSVLVKRDRGTGAGGWEKNRQPDVIHRNEIPNEGTVADAVRGWPGYQYTGERQKGGNQEGDSSEWNGNNDDLLPDIFKDLPKVNTSKQPPRTTKKTPGGGDKRHARKGGITQEENEDAAMGDLMSQRFHHEYLAQRELEMAREKRRKELKAQAVAEGRRAARDRTDIKANRTSQLRSIANAEKVETSPYDLWQMNKFKHAQAHVSTFRTGRSGKSAGSKNDDDEGHEPCTCDNGHPSYDDDLEGLTDRIGAEVDVPVHGYSHLLSAL